MQKRLLGRTKIEVGEIGFGCEGFDGKTPTECQKMVDYALQNGINCYDMYTADPVVRKNVGEALARHKRESYVVQGHLCSYWKNGQYCRTRNVDEVKTGFAELLSLMHLDYVDVGMIHYVDALDDFDKVFNGDVLRYCLKQKRLGRIKCIGISTHNTDIAYKAAESGYIDVIMFSVNPAYDMLPATENVDEFFEEGAFSRVAYKGIEEKREKLYAFCQNKGVALTVMKCFAGGLLLDEKQSPFLKAMSVTQCLHYCLTRPSVATVLAGMKFVEEIKECLKYNSATAEEKDYSTVLANAPNSTFSGHCMYCGHCAPCSVAIDIADVNKFLDLAKTHDEVKETVKEHYALLSHHANECIECGKCEKNCPFGVKIIEKMRQAKEIFGK